MTIRMTILAATIGLSALITAPVHAGGPVIIEETPLVEADTEDGRRPGWIVPAAIFTVVLIAIASGGGDVCNGDEEPAVPGCQ